MLYCYILSCTGQFNYKNVHSRARLDIALKWFRVVSLMQMAKFDILDLIVILCTFDEIIFVLFFTILQVGLMEYTPFDVIFPN